MFHQNTYPLFLAPMEGVGDRAFRKAMAFIGGFDHATTEFIRVPINAHVQSLAKVYKFDDTGSIPQAAQIMGFELSTMSAMAKELENRQAPRIDLNCGCPSNTVTGRGAGSSLLKDPNHLYKLLNAIKNSVSIPVSAKLRSGFLDTSLFKENILAAQEAGASFITLHPRTKEDGYKAPANWQLIYEAKQLLKIPVVGNGDIQTKDDALRMIQETGCDGIMIGRGAVTNPFIFHEIKEALYGKKKSFSGQAIIDFLTTYYKEMPEDMPDKTKINKLKQIYNFLFTKNPILQNERQMMLTRKYTHSQEALELNLPILAKFYFEVI